MTYSLEHCYNYKKIKFIISNPSGFGNLKGYSYLDLF
jgi:hypothetical protein